MEILPNPNADADCDEADAEIERIEDELEDIRKRAKQQLKLQDREIKYWDNGMGGKEIFQLQIPAKTKVPANWTKSTNTKVSGVSTPIKRVDGHTGV
jgi:DNA mismatch repair protein MSH6